MEKRWVLRLAGLEPPQYLTPPGSRCVWTTNIEHAEAFLGASQAINTARLASHVRGVPIEAVSVAQDEPRERCITLGCDRPVEGNRHHCAHHGGVWRGLEIAPRPAVETIDPDVFAGLEIDPTLTREDLMACHGLAVRTVLESSDESLDEIEAGLERYLNIRGIASTY